MAATNLNKYLSDFFFFFTIENSTSPIHKLKKKKNLTSTHSLAI